MRRKGCSAIPNKLLLARKSSGELHETMLGRTDRARKKREMFNFHGPRD